MKIEIELNGHTYFIEDDGRSHNAYKTGKTAEGKYKEVNIGFCMNLSSAVNKVVRDALAENKETVDLLTYVKRYETALEDCKQFCTF